MRRPIALAFAVGLLLSCVAAANALPITFSEYPVGTAVTNQYQGVGVLFSGGSVTPGAPVIDWNGAMPTQPILRPAGEEAGYYTYNGDFWMDFVQPVVSVSFLSGYWDVVGTGVIDLYDAYGSLITSATNTGTGPQTMSFSGLGSIKKIYFNSFADPAGADIDNLDFTPVPEPSTLLLLALGGTGLLGGRLRRRK